LNTEKIFWIWQLVMSIIAVIIFTFAYNHFLDEYGKIDTIFTAGMISAVIALVICSFFDKPVIRVSACIAFSASAAFAFSIPGVMVFGFALGIRIPFLAFPAAFLIPFGVANHCNLDEKIDWKKTNLYIAIEIIIIWAAMSIKVFLF